MSFRCELRKRAKAQCPERDVCGFSYAGDGGPHLNFVRPYRLSAIGNDFEDRLQHVDIDIAANEFDRAFRAAHGFERKNQKYYDHYTQQKIKDHSGLHFSGVKPVY